MLLGPNRQKGAGDPNWSRRKKEKSQRVTTVNVSSDERKKGKDRFEGSRSSTTHLKKREGMRSAIRHGLPERKKGREECKQNLTTPGEGRKKGEKEVGAKTRP